MSAPLEKYEISLIPAYLSSINCIHGLYGCEEAATTKPSKSSEHKVCCRLEKSRLRYQSPRRSIPGPLSCLQSYKLLPAVMVADSTEKVDLFRFCEEL